MIPEPEEYDLALRARNGDLAALGELVERTRLGLFRLAYALLGSYEDANDAVAAALLQVCLHVRELRDPGRMLPWMRSIVRNEARRLGRRRTDETPLREEDAQPDSLTAGLLRLDIERALRQLSPNQARVVRLFYLEELTVEEISRQTDHPAGTIKSWLHRGRRQLCRQMEGYAPMQPVPPTPDPSSPLVAVIHSDLAPDILREVTRALTEGRHRTQILVPSDMTELVASLADYRAVILDERLGEHSVFELLVHMKSDPRLDDLPVCVLAIDPSPFTATAYFGAGVDRLVNKSNPEELRGLATPLEKRAEAPSRRGTWQRFTERARRVVFFAQEEAARLNTNEVAPEHLLLGLVREEDSLAGRLLNRLGVPPSQIRKTLEGQLTPGTGGLGNDMLLTQRAKRVIDVAEEEATRLGHNYLGTEHLLLGLLGEAHSLAAKVLVELGLSLERFRQAVQEAAGTPTPPSSTS